MKFIVAPDSFKGSLTSIEAARALARGIHRVLPDAEVIEIPIADGGEGTLDAMLSATTGKRLSSTVCGPVGEQVVASFGLIGDGHRTAIIEMAQAAGLALVPPDKRDPRYTTTYGVGELIQQALDSGAERLIVGLGGSGTNDGGAGAMLALGARFFDKHGQPLPRPLCGANLSRLDRIDMEQFRLPANTVEVIIASDVSSPLIGDFGASAVYGPQKGATPAAVAELDRCLNVYAEVIERDLGVDVRAVPGGGAAGGLGAALIAFLGAKMTSGIDLILDEVGFDSKLSCADYVFTGEGRIDSQTLNGKVLLGILLRCKQRGVPVVAFGGSVEESAAAVLVKSGLMAAVPIVRSGLSLEEAIQNASLLLEEASSATALQIVLSNV